MKKLVAEFIGTFFLVLTVALTNNPLAIGVVLMIMIYVLGWVSGGHFNPAVTIGLFVGKKIERNLAIKYIVAQLLGGLFASAAYFLITNQQFVPAMNTSYTFVSALFAEAIFTFALVLAVFSVGFNKKISDNQYFGAVIGLVVFVGATAVGTISGGAFNPAVGVTPLIFDIKDVSANLINIALYTAGPIIGGVLAAIAFRYFEEGK